MLYIFFLLFMSQFHAHAIDTQTHSSESFIVLDGICEELCPITVEKLYVGSSTDGETEKLCSAEVTGFSSEKYGVFIKSPSGGRTITKSPRKLVKYPTGKRPWECPKCGEMNIKEAKMCDHCHWDSEKDPLWVQVAE